MTDFRPRIPNIMKLVHDLEADYSHIHSILKGARSPSVALAKRIEAATGGVIRWTEFFEETPAQEPPPIAAA
jgi:hypothetical protein